MNIPSVIVENDRKDGMSEMNWDWLNNELARYQDGIPDIHIGLPIYWLFKWTYMNADVYSVCPDIRPELLQYLNIDYGGDYDTWGSQR